MKIIIMFRVDRQKRGHGDDNQYRHIVGLGNVEVLDVDGAGDPRWSTAPDFDFCRTLGISDTALGVAARAAVGEASDKAKITSDGDRVIAQLGWVRL